MLLAPVPFANDVLVRSARPEDAAAIEALYRQLVPGDARVSVCPARIAQVRDDPASLLLAAEQVGRVVGTAFATSCIDVMYRDRPYLVIENVVVDAAARGGGVGRALLSTVDAVGLAADASKIMLLSGARRTEAHRFFESCGYSPDAKLGFVRYRSAISVSAMRPST